MEFKTCFFEVEVAVIDHKLSSYPKVFQPAQNTLVLAQKTILDPLKDIGTYYDSYLQVRSSLSWVLTGISNSGLIA